MKRKSEKTTIANPPKRQKIHHVERSWSAKSSNSSLSMSDQICALELDEELEVQGVLESIKNRRQWREKCQKPRIVQVWRREAIEQQVSVNSFERALIIAQQQSSNDNSPKCALQASLSSENLSQPMLPDTETEMEVSGACENMPENLPPSSDFVVFKEKCAFSDTLFDQEQRSQLIDGLDKLSNIAESKQDWQPGTKKQILNLINPSMYAYVRGTSVLSNGSVECIDDNFCQFKGSDERKWRTDRQKILEGRSIYQWLPSDVEVDENGNARLVSYINNLHSVPFLQTTFEKLFSSLLPLFQRVLRRDLCNSKLQVIVKACNIVLTENNPVYMGETWHVDGMKHEKIIASAMYNYQQKNITTSSLSFREVQGLYTEGENHEVKTLGSRAPKVKRLGTIAIPENRCIVFDNDLQHQVQRFEIAGQATSGYQKMLYFFLIDPKTPLLSTSHVPMQQNELLKPLYSDMFVNYRILPRVLANIVVDYMSPGMTLKEAQRYRRRSMRERKAVTSWQNEEIILYTCNDSDESDSY